MPNKLFVAGLPFVFSDAELGGIFSVVGKVVSAEMVPDPAWGRTRGFGFVEMSTAEEAQTAISRINGTKVGGKNIYVTVAREKKPTAARPVHPDGSTTQASPPPSDPPRKGGRLDRPPRPPRPDSTLRSPYAPREPGRFSPGGNFPREPGGFGRSRPPFSRPGRPSDRPGPPGRRPPSGNRAGKNIRPEGSAYPRFGGSGERKGFAPPGRPAGDFGPGSRPFRPFKKFGKPTGRPESGSRPKKEFWRKFDKKKPE